MSSRGLQDVTNVLQENRPDKLVGHVDNAKRSGAPFQSNWPPEEDGFEPATPGNLIDRRDPSASTTDRGSLQKVVTTRMLDAEQRLRRVLEQEGWTPSPRRNQHQVGYTPVRGATPSLTSRQSSPHSMQGRLISPALESNLYPPSQSETAECASLSNPPLFSRRDQCQTVRKDMLPGVNCIQNDLSEEISNSAHPPENLHVTPTIEEGNSADALRHGESIRVDCKESHDKENQYLHRQRRNNDSTINHNDSLCSLQEHDITQRNNRPNPMGVQAYNHTAANVLGDHQLSLGKQHTVVQQFVGETRSIISTSKQQRVAELQHEVENQKYDSCAKLADQQHVSKAGTNLQSHVSMEIRAVQEPTNIIAPQTIPQNITKQQVDKFLKIMPVIFNRLEHLTGYMSKGKSAHLVRCFVDSTSSIAGDCASSLSRWKLSRWQAMIAVYIVALHVLVCYHVLQYLEHPHSGKQFYK